MDSLIPVDFDSALDELERLDDDESSKNETYS